MRDGTCHSSTTTSLLPITHMSNENLKPAKYFLKPYPPQKMLGIVFATTPLPNMYIRVQYCYQMNNLSF